MKPSHLANALALCIDAGRPAFMWGPPGVGKSQLVRQVAAKMGLELRDVRAVLLDPVDLRGLPHVNGDGRAHWAIPDFLPRDGRGVLFLDELNAAPALVQAACYQLILDRQLGEYRLPDGWQVIAAGNNDSDRAVTQRMPTPLRSRFVNLEFDVDHDDWTAHALRSGFRVEVVAFIRFKAEMLHKFDRDSKAFPCPRTWEFVSNILDRAPSKDIEHALYTGCVGEGAATEFLGFLRVYRTLPSPDAIILNPNSGDVPTDPATLYALCGTLARKASDTTFANIVTYCARLPAEFSVSLVRDAITRVPALKDTRAFIEWSSANASVLV